MILEFTDVACVRGGRVLFEGLSFSLGEGAALHVSGPNGTGKSSLIRLAAGLLVPAEGQVERTGEVALADERLALDDRPLGEALGWWSALDRAQAGPAMEQAGIAHLAAVPVRMLSTGQRKRAALARVIASGAPLWLLDEPANGLDDAGTAMLVAELTAHLAGGGAAVIASHQPLALNGLRTLSLPL